MASNTLFQKRQDQACCNIVSRLVSGASDHFIVLDSHLFIVLDSHFQY